jgi:hypothetical protein
MGLTMPTEADTCRTYIVPKLHAAGWEDDFIAEQRVTAAGRIVPVVKSTRARNRAAPITFSLSAGIIRLPWWKPKPSTRSPATDCSKP